MPTVFSVPAVNGVAVPFSMRVRVLARLEVPLHVLRGHLEQAVLMQIPDDLAHRRAALTNHISLPPMRR